MLRASIVFFVLAIIAHFLGAYGIAGITAEFGRILLFVFLAIAGISFVVGLLSGRGPKNLV